MLTKFETKSNRVKGLSFHPKRPWILVSLHSGVIQLWDYRMGTLIERFSEHEGPVRGVDFHNSQPLFVSGGDDYKVKVWNYNSRRCLFTLLGHLDYIRTVEFHKEAPWIVSASDDQTIRVWNWQSRSCLDVLTGHNHYVMSAFFHSRDDLIVSASLDQTVRVWDIAQLRKKSASPSESSDFMRLPQVSADIFGSGFACVRFVLEGHERGVNWAAFHPTLPLIVSASDDRSLKLWRMNDTKAWEIDTLRGHTYNVSCAQFLAGPDLIVSNSEDKSLRVWDMSKRTAMHTFKREGDRFWVLEVHPEINLLAAGHDSGLVVFKLERERAPMSFLNGSVYYVKERHLRKCQLNSLAGQAGTSDKQQGTRRSDTTGAQSKRGSRESNTANDEIIATLKKQGTNNTSQGTPSRAIAVSHDEEVVALSYAGDPATVEIMPISSEEGMNKPTGIRIHGQCPVFTARNRITVALEGTQGIAVHNLKGEVVRRTTSPIPNFRSLLPHGTGSVMFATDESIHVMDVQQCQITSSANVGGVKYAAWSHDHKMVALMSKHMLTIADRALGIATSVQETSRIKGAAFDENQICVYTTLDHIKFALSNGDTGIICSIDRPIYILHVHSASVFAVDRTGSPFEKKVDLSEALFKSSLLNSDVQGVLRHIHSGSLCGESITEYLREKGHSEVALNFAKGNKTRLSLALSCGNIEIALESAQQIDDQMTWRRLGEEALRQGNFEVAEYAHQRTRNFGKLAFLYLIVGDSSKLRRMLKIADADGDVMARYQNALYLGDARERVHVLENADHLPLAYLTAKTHGIENDASRLHEELVSSSMPIPEVKSDARLLSPPTPIQKSGNWPLLAVPKGALASGIIQGTSTNAKRNGVDAMKASQEEMANAVVDMGASGGWDLGEEVDEEEKEEQIAGGWDDEELDLQGIAANAPTTQKENTGGQETYRVPQKGRSFTDRLKELNVPVAMAAAGDFERAMSMLRTQAGVRSFEKIRKLMVDQAVASSLPAPGMPNSKPVYLAMAGKGAGEEDASKLPRVLITPEMLEEETKSNEKLVTDGKFNEALPAFKSTLQKATMTVASTRKEREKIQEEIVKQSKEYINALQIETERKKVQANSPKRSCELSAYFANCDIKGVHLMLALRNAMNINIKCENYNTAFSLSHRLFDSSPPEKLLNQAKQAMQICESYGKQDKLPIDLSPKNPFVVCAKSLEPIYLNNPSAKCPLCSCECKTDYKGELCPVCDIAEVGFDASGLNLLPSSSDRQRRRR